LDIVLIAADIVVCVALLAFSHDWRGPFWLYAVSAVFYPAYRFTLRGALLSVVAFDLLVLLTGLDSIRETFRAGFGGDFVAREVTVLIVAGAVSLTSRALRQVRDLAAETERNRIARDLHDGVGKTLGGISMEAGTLALWIDRDPVEARRRARTVARISERAALDVRAVIRSLRQRESTAPLLPSVQSIAREWERGRPEVLELRVSGPNVEVPVLIADEVLRMLSELLENVARHASARHVWVRLTLSSTGVTLAVRDDGVGFDTSLLDPWSGEGHFGLLGARERASMLGGLFNLTSSPEAGTDVTIDLPLAQRAERGGLPG
jgi:signal transduction histidine kinase